MSDIMPPSVNTMPPSSIIPDEDLHDIEYQLEQFKKDHWGRQHETQHLLEKYTDLLSCYKKLKKSVDYNADRSGLSSIPRNDKSPHNDRLIDDRDHCVLVIVDGEGYLPHATFLQASFHSGGKKAAEWLHYDIAQYLYDKKIHFSRILVRIYGDPFVIARNAGIAPEDLQDLFIGFSEAKELFDFIPVFRKGRAEREERMEMTGVQRKIGEILKLDVEESSTCSHILFAACHDLHYLAHLEPYTGDWFFRNRITLVEGAGFKNEFRKLGFPVTSFPGVFGWSEREVSLSEDDQGSVDSAIKIKGIDKGADPEKRPRDEEDLISLSSRSDSGSKVVISHGRARSGTVEAGPSRPLTNRYLRTSEVPCKYYARGICKHGRDCKFLHASPPSWDLSPSPTPEPTRHHQTSTPLSHTLPTTVVPGFIPLNASDHRLDLVITLPSSSLWNSYNNTFGINANSSNRTGNYSPTATRFPKPPPAKPCTAYHLTNSCNTSYCTYNHADLDPALRPVLEYIVKTQVCARGGDCRLIGCVYGHHCQRPCCKGGQEPCKFPREMHVGGPVARYVPGVKKVERLVDGGNLNRHGSGSGSGERYGNGHGGGERFVSQNRHGHGYRHGGGAKERYDYHGQKQERERDRKRSSESEQRDRDSKRRHGSVKIGEGALIDEWKGAQW